MPKSTPRTAPGTDTMPTGTGVWTGERIRALGAVTDLPTAAAIFGLSRTIAYELAKHGQFPVPILRAGARYRVPVAPILAALHITDNIITDPPT